MKKLSIQILVADTADENQLNIGLELPAIMADYGQEGYNLAPLVNTAMEVYELDTKYDISVDYWSNSLQMFIICDNLFFGKKGSSNKSNLSMNSGGSSGS